MRSTSALLAVVLGALSTVLASPIIPVDSVLVSQSPKKEPQSTPYVPKINPKSGCASNCNSTLHFASPAAARYQVTNEIPSNTFRTPTSWAGEMSNGSKQNNTLFFWLWGADKEGSTKDTVIWLNGGPGCSSLIGFLQENSPISYNPTMTHPQPNPYSWTKAANMLWVEQPAGVGFSRLNKGTPPLKDESGIAEGFVGFLAEFKKTFPELFVHGQRLWIAAESYGGQYAPYIAQRMYKDGNLYNLQGLMLVDALFSDYTLQTDVTALEYGLHNQAILKLAANDTAELKRRSDKCGYSNYTKANLHYPSRRNLPAFNEEGCGTYGALTNGAARANPNFNVYRITDRQNLTDVLAPYNESAPTFFDNSALQDAIHADRQKWAECDSSAFDENVFDESPPPDSNGVLKYVLESSPAQRNVVVHGALDARLLLNGTLLALQNLTWNKGRGFTRPLTVPLVGTDGKVTGTYRTERGLTGAIANTAGHTVPSPQDAPALGLALVKFLVGTGKLS